MMDKSALINGYFEGTLSANQSEELERLRQSDAEFASAFALEKELQLALKKSERQELKAMFSGLNKDSVVREAKVFRLGPWLAAASIALVISVGSWLLFFNSTDINTDALYAANFAPYDNVVHPIERGDLGEDLKTRAFMAYEVADYKKALKLFDELGEKQTDSYIDFYAAIVLMQLNDHENAIPLLEGYIEANGELKDRAIWYQALAHLKMGEVDKAKTALMRLVKMGSFKTADAKNLLNTLS